MSALGPEADSDRVSLPDALRDASKWRLVLLSPADRPALASSNQRRGKKNFRAGTIAVHVRLCRLSAHGCACLGPACSENQDAMQQLRVIKSVMPGRCRELLALRYFGI